MTKKNKVFNYLMEHIKIDQNDIEKLKCQPIEKIDFMGGVKKWYLLCCSNYYFECKKAIQYAGYKYPDSNQTWRTVEEIKELVVRQKLMTVKL